jgi:protein-tyrosine kinase
MDRISKAVDRIRKERGEIVRPIESAAPFPASGEPDIRRIEVSRDLLHRNRIWLGEDHGESAQAFKVLRTRVWHQMRANGWHTLGITSANPGEGKTMTAINLAINLAMMEIGRKVVLVDLDLRRPGVHKSLGIRPEFGVSDFLLGGTPLLNIMIDVGIERLVLVPGNASFLNASEILSSKKLAHLFQEIKNLFPSRIVIIDLPPILAADDVLVVSSHINSFLLLVEEGRTQDKDVSKALELLGDAKILGTVLNKSADSTEQYYGY